jgi:hypothetical protein
MVREKEEKHRRNQDESDLIDSFSSDPSIQLPFQEGRLRDREDDTNSKKINKRNIVKYIFPI